MSKHVLVLKGGPDAEREVSLESGAAVAQALRNAGRFAVTEQTILRVGNAELAAMKGDVIFPVLHGSWGEGGPLQAILERDGRPFVGSRAKPAARAMDKLATKTLLAADHVPSPSARELRPGQPCDLEPPLVLKPVDDGSSVDIRICKNKNEVTAGREALHPKRTRLMAERYVPGRELTVGILLDQPLPIIEIKAAEHFYDYNAKYERQDTVYTINPDLPDRIAKDAIRVAMLAFTRLGCRDIARVDFRFDGERLWFLEINTMPGFTAQSLVPKAAQSVGLGFSDVCHRLVQAALKRQEATLTPSA